jgi:cytoplasmic iron level regulating protein YaaA (DUF328/UPF0246 family)
MITIISPAKSLNFNNPVANYGVSTPRFMADSKRLMDSLKKKSVKKLKEMMDISDDLALTNFDRNQLWLEDQKLNETNTALFAFTGEVYRGLNAKSMKSQTVEYTNDHLRILSGLYGLLKPLDLIQPYRLEMGTSLKTTRGKNLYEFWGERVVTSLLQDLEELSGKAIVNLASAEYYKVLQPKAIKKTIVTPVFKDSKNGVYKIIFTYAKKARGLMTRFIMDNKIEDQEHLKAFNIEGYYFDSTTSNSNEFVFLRDH